MKVANFRKFLKNLFGPLSLLAGTCMKVENPLTNYSTGFFLLLEFVSCMATVILPETSKKSRLGTTFKS